MTPPETDASATARVGWTDAGRLSEPLVRTAPYVELTLQHPSLAPTAVGTSFFPDAVPYRSGEEHRVFYWRGVLGEDPPAPDRWTAACATTDDLAALTHGRSFAPTVETGPRGGAELVVDGTVAGDATTAHVTGYDPPDVALRHVTQDAAEVALPAEDRLVPPGSRETVTLPAQTVRDDDGARTTVTPELTVRYPGERTLYHPAPAAGYRLFPSFGLSLADLPNPVAVPTSGGELDHRALATALGVDLAARPYPERVLWQAFAHAAFDPHRDGRPGLSQFPGGRLAVAP